MTASATQFASSDDESGASSSLRDDRCSLGFCLWNNAAIVARYAMLEHPKVVRRVAIVDWDLHHGNGTEEIVRKAGWEQVCQTVTNRYKPLQTDTHPSPTLS